MNKAMNAIAVEKMAYTVPEAGVALGICRSKVYSLIKSGDFPVVMVGKSLRVPVDGLRAWLASRTYIPGSPKKDDAPAAGPRLINISYHESLAPVDLGGAS